MGVMLRAPLFVPASRPERFEKAAASGADAIILDCEDAVPPDLKELARRSLRTNFTELPVYIRVNGADTPWHDEDLRAAATLPFAGLILPKAEIGSHLEKLSQTTEFSGKIVPLIETVRGLSQARQIASMRGVSVLAFGSVDFSADSGFAHTRIALAAARSEIVIASRLAGISAPVDGITAAINDEALAEDDARHSAEMGFGGKLCIHPSQIAPVLRGLRPTEEEIRWATSVLDAGVAAISLSGSMVDKAVQLRAKAVFERLG